MVTGNSSVFHGALDQCAQRARNDAPVSGESRRVWEEAFHMPTTHPSESVMGRVRRMFWVAALIVLMLLAVSAAGVLAGCGSDEDETAGAASGDVATMMQDWIAAHNAGDKDKLATIYAENAIVEDFLVNGTPPAITEGGDKAAEMSAYWGNEGMLFKSSGETLQVGPYVVQAMMYVTPDGVRGGEGVHVLKLDGDGKIAHEWASGQASDE